MFYYKHQDKYLFSLHEYPDLPQSSEQQLMDCADTIYYLTAKDPQKSRRSFCVSFPTLLYNHTEGLELLLQSSSTSMLPPWLEQKIAQGQVKAVNTSYPNWQSDLKAALPDSWHVNIVGLGDVGSTLLVGLKLLGADKIAKLGIYDIDESKVTRWEFEANQIVFPNGDQSPKVERISEEELFDCDMFVFCVTVGIPSLDSRDIDVRMAQFEGNGRIIAMYAQKARQAGFKGIFAVVSDPVDLLCKKALLESNRDEYGVIDHRGLAPEQIRGYGLGVMHARAAYYAEQSPESRHYLLEGRAFGPHGEHLVIADSIARYNDQISMELTEKARKANLELRKHGYKPYIAPALSSGAIALLETVRGNWHYSATYMGGVYMGSRNKLTAAGIILEQYDLPEQLMTRLNKSYKELESII